MSEEWRPIDGFLGLYEVSSLGRVRGLDRPGRSGPGRVGKVLTPFSCFGGYLGVKLSDRGIRKTLRIHPLVLNAFKGKKSDPSHEARHLDGNKLNNSVSNLAWGTKQENAADRIDHGTQVRGERAGAAKLTARQVLDIKQDGRVSRVIASEYGVSSRQIRHVKSGRQWRHA